MSDLLEGKTILIMGVANKRSIAWGIARSMHREGARLILAYEERNERKVQDLIDEGAPGSLKFPCDVSSDTDLDRLFADIKQEVGTIDGAVHSIAFAKREELSGRYADTSRDGFLLAHEISVYSFVGAARRAAELMPNGGSLLTLTYLGAERVVSNYNVMGVAKASLEASMRYLASDLGPAGIRVNAISAGPIRTVSASGVGGFTDILDPMAEKAPLRRNVDQDEVGDVAMFLASHLARGVTGEVIYVDSGYHIMGL